MSQPDSMENGEGALAPLLHASLYLPQLVVRVLRDGDVGAIAQFPVCAVLWRVCFSQSSSRRATVLPQ